MLSILADALLIAAGQRLPLRSDEPQTRRPGDGRRKAHR
jgi:hypothetical protein